ncbi:uncharacterized protein LOC143279475 [Babylonia areolata]|uniref:uncharacterized protein LOC143279475 n=1 Tax=Babylonia areolata TaxID=304850 RepID=UPI003FD33C20
MKLFLVVLVTVLVLPTLCEAQGETLVGNDFDIGREGFVSVGRTGKTSGKKAKDKSFEKIIEKTETLKNNQVKLSGQGISINNNQTAIEENLQNFLEKQSILISLSQDITRDAHSLESQTGTVLQNQKSILENQKAIESSIKKRHWAARELMNEIEKEIELDTVLKNQKGILASLTKSEEQLAKGFKEVENSQEKVVDLIKELETVIDENSNANAQGQANLTAEIGASEEQTQQLVSRAQERQGTILDTATAIETSEEKKLDQAAERQEGILTGIKDSQETTQNSISKLLKNEQQFQDVNKESQTSIQKDIDKVLSSQTETKHLSKYCQKAGDCDLRNVEFTLDEIAQFVASFEDTILKDFENIRGNAEEKKILENAETDVKNNAHSGFRQLNKQIGSVEVALGASKGKVQNMIQATKNSINNIKKSQDSAWILANRILKVVKSLKEVTRIISLTH